MTYPFVAGISYGKRAGPVRAFVIHMAEGGGTVGFLRNDATPPPRGVSVHYVIEYTGRIVQMVMESQASGSINPNDIRTTDDPDGFFGASAAKAVMGSWWSNPNAAAITCEVEGFAKTGPNAAQHGSLKKLIGELRGRYPDIGLLGHRDFQDYKACPGKLVHWDDLGGHGPAHDTQGEPEVSGLNVTDLERFNGTVTVVTPGTLAVNVADPTIRTGLPVGAVKDAIYKGRLDPPLDTAPGDRATVYGVGKDQAVLLAMNVRPEPIVVGEPDCSGPVAAEHERTKAAALAAVEAI